MVICAVARSVILALAVLLASLAMQPGPSQAEPQSFKAVDLLLMQALKEKAGKRALELFGIADGKLVEVNRARRTTAKSATDLDVTVRASLIDMMRDAVGYELQQSVLESVRQQVKALDLARSLLEAASVQQAEKSAELEQLVTAVYDRLAATGASDKNADIEFSVAEGEKLIFRIFVLQEGTRLSAFELAGNRVKRLATWRETPLAARSSGLLSKAGTVIGAPTATKVPFPSTAYPFLLVLSDDVGEVDAAGEGKLAERLNALLGLGIVPIVVEAASRLEPLLKVPAIQSSPDVRAGLSGNAAGLLHRASGTLLFTSAKLTGLRDLDALLPRAVAIATELLGDIGRTPPDAEAFSLERITPVPLASSAKQRSSILAPVEDTIAASVQGGRRVKLGPHVPLYLVASLPGTDWGQYGGTEPDSTVLIWLRHNQLQTYVPPAPAVGPSEENREAAEPRKRKSSKAAPDTEAKGLTGTISEYLLLGDPSPAPKASRPATREAPR